MYFPSYRMCKKAIEQLMHSFIFFFYCSLERELVAGPAGAASRPSRAGPGWRAVPARRAWPAGPAGRAWPAGPAGDYT